MRERACEPHFSPHASQQVDPAQRLNGAIGVGCAVEQDTVRKLAADIDGGWNDRGCVSEHCEIIRGYRARRIMPLQRQPLSQSGREEFLQFL